MASSSAAPIRAPTAPRWAGSRVRAAPRALAVGSLGVLARGLERAATVSTYLAAGLLRFDELARHAAENWRRFGLAQSEADVAEGLFGWERRFYARCITPGEREIGRASCRERV